MTTLWTFLFAPLLILPIALLFRFVGCAAIYDFDDFDTSQPKLPKPEPVPDYRNYIMGRQPTEGTVRHPEVRPNVDDVIGYWRLIDPSDSAKAADEKRSFEGLYKTSSDPDLTPGNFGTGQNSLLASAPALHCRFFNGGFVAIPDTGGLHTEEFTIEAWIDPEFSHGAEHTLFHASGLRPGNPDASKPGFRVYATEEREWQVDLEVHGPVFPHPPLMPVGSGRMHLAVIVERVDGQGKMSVTIVIDGRHPVTHTISGTYSPPDGAPLLIGVKRESYPELEPTNPDLSGSIQSTLQEVVLHRKALSLNEIENHVGINRAPRVLP